MSRIFFCEACNMIRHGVKSRIALQHAEGCELNRISYGLPNGGNATFNSKPNIETLEALDELVKAASKIKKYLCKQQKGKED